MKQRDSSSPAAWTGRFVLIVTALVVAACGGGSDGAGTSGSVAPPGGGACSSAGDCGTVLVAVTDAEGDFLSYSVDVESITLERANGATVETLPATTRVDFAELTDLSELLSAVAVPPGEIVGGTIRLDYSTAEIFVETGGDIVAAEIVDANGSALGIEELEIRLSNRDRLVVTRGRIAFLSLDFDLAASHTVDTSASPPRVVAEPYLTAAVVPVETRELRVRGALVEVDTADSTYTIRLRPAFRRVRDHGLVTVHTDAATSFEIGDASYAGAEGLAALAALEPGTLTAAFGTLDLANREFVAETVHARGSVGGVDVDAVHGHVVARAGDVLTVRGGLTVSRDGPMRFHRAVVVELGPGTVVHKHGDPDASPGLDAISVGQRVVALGTLAAPDANGGADAPLTLDATEGRVRMLVTRLSGTVVGTTAGQLDLDLGAIGRLGIELFDFAGTGPDAASDADPGNYEIATAALALDGLVTGRPARVLGFVTPFGAAPPDFEGRSVVDHRDLRAALGIGYGAEGTDAAFVSMGPDGLVPNLDTPDLGLRHHILIGARLIDLTGLGSAPTIAPAGDPDLYALHEPGHVELFGEFGDFVDELAARLGAGDRVRAVTAYGRYDEAPNALDARHVVVHTIPLE